MPDGLRILPVRGIGEITPGTDLAEAITRAAPWLLDGDVLVVTSKIVSKAEGQLVDIPTSGPEREATRQEILRAETARVVARRGDTRIVQTHHGFVMAAAGIDASNVESSRLVLLPKDPDGSARSLRAALRERFNLDVAVIISDTMGRPWRIGLTDVALGAAGLDPIVDYRGETDAYGNEMVVTQIAVVDELSGAAELVKGKFDQVPVAVIRGYLSADTAGAVAPAPPASPVPAAPQSAEGSGADASPQANGPTVSAPASSPSSPASSAARPGPPSSARLDAAVTLGLRGDGPGAAAMIRESALDLFSLGTAEARAVGLADAANLPDADAFGDALVDRAVVARALASPLVIVEVEVAVPEHTQWLIGIPMASTPEALVDLGTAVHRTRCALAAHGIASMRLPSPSPSPEWVGIIAVGSP
jgi:coenzyme F420-0:L-glutamate ligase/coenzyme F420-1:gamma-L-glutamate ligase